MTDAKRTRGPLTPLAAAIGAGLRSGDPLLRGAALTRLGAVLIAAHGNLTHVAKVLGVPRRTLLRWQSEDAEVAALVERARGV